MAINKVQFQIGLGLVEFFDRFTEEDCKDYIRKQKWPQGFICRRCSHHKESLQKRANCEIHECLSCFYQESLIAHTLFEHTRLPLRTWFLAIQILTQAKTCISALELHRQLNVNFKTALSLKHKIMQVLTDAESARRLHGRVECNEAYLGGPSQANSSEDTAKKKTPFIAAVQTDEARHPQKVVLTAIQSFTEDEIKNWSQEHLEKSSLVLTSDLSCFRYFSEYCEHEKYGTSRIGEIPADYDFKWINTVLKNVKTAFSGALHAFNFRKYAYRYLGNMQFRFNHRYDLRQCFYDVINLCISSPPITEKKLFSEIAG